ncbi:MAG: hypothetical protein PVG14_03225 [Anaerolineales bacterium]
MSGLKNQVFKEELAAFRRIGICLMATWIGHLRIAENLLSLIDNLDAEQFTVGNLAPDSGLPDEKWERFDPPPEITHFKDSGEDDAEIQDLRFFDEYLASEKVRPDVARFSFLLGYFFHLVTDRYWYFEIGKPTMKRYSKQFEEDSDFIWEVKRDWYGLDHLYLREHPDSLFFGDFQAYEYRKDYLDFLTAEAIQHRIDEIRTVYQRDDERIHSLIERPFIFLGKDDMNRFVSNATDHLNGIHQILIVEQRDYNAARSSLDMLL